VEIREEEDWEMKPSTRNLKATKRKGVFFLKNSSTKIRVYLGEKFVSDDVIMRRFVVHFIGSALRTRGSVLSVKTKRNWCSIWQHTEYLGKAMGAG